MKKPLVWVRAIACAGVLTGLAACNDDLSSSTDSPTSTTSNGPGNPGGEANGSGNVAPKIVGSPRSEIAVDQTYRFTPAASDKDGDSLTFSISSKPGWASFDSSSGRLAGTPTAADVGLYEEITISVSDGAISTQLSQFSIAVVQQSNGGVTLAWQAPTENIDGTPLTNLGGYTVHYGTESGNYDQTIEITSPGITRYVIENLSPGTWYFAISAVTSQGIESNLSGEASKTI